MSKRNLVLLFAFALAIAASGAFGFVARLGSVDVFINSTHNQF